MRARRRGPSSANRAGHGPRVVSVSPRSSSPRSTSRRGPRRAGGRASRGRCRGRARARPGRRRRRPACGCPRRPARRRDHGPTTSSRSSPRGRSRSRIRPSRGSSSPGPVRRTRARRSSSRSPVARVIPRASDMAPPDMACCVGLSVKTPGRWPRGADSGRRRNVRGVAPRTFRAWSVGTQVRALKATERRVRPAGEHDAAGPQPTRRLLRNVIRLGARRGKRTVDSGVCRRGQLAAAALAKSKRSAAYADRDSGREAAIALYLRLPTELCEGRLARIRSGRFVSREGNTTRWSLFPCCSRPRAASSQVAQAKKAVRTWPCCRHPLPN